MFDDSHASIGFDQTLHPPPDLDSVAEAIERRETDGGASAIDLLEPPWSSDADDGERTYTVKP